MILLLQVEDCNGHGFAMFGSSAFALEYSHSKAHSV